MDFDSGLLNDCFKQIKGSPEEMYNERLANLVRVTIRLKNLNKNHKFDEILHKIDKFLAETKLVPIKTKVDDYEHKNGRVLKFVVGGNEQSTTIETYGIDKEKIRQEQFFELSNKVYLLYSEAMSKLETEFNWHRDDMLEEIEIDMQENLGKKSQQEEKTDGGTKPAAIEPTIHS